MDKWGGWGGRRNKGGREGGLERERKEEEKGKGEEEG